MISDTRVQSYQFNLGAVSLDCGCTMFRIWAPLAEAVSLHQITPQNRDLPMERDERGYFQLIVDDIPAGSRYFYNVNGQDRPDPASRYQPEGIYGPSEVLRSDFIWEDYDWDGIPLEEYIFYELHVGTFTAEGTFDAIIPHLNEIKDLGITAIELMPIAQFPGGRNWGYDGVYAYAPQNTYGGPDGLRRLVNACHARGLALVLDVVYNHFGPEGNFIGEYANYFSDCYVSNWGSCLNFDGAQSDNVRQFFIENALHWITEYHIDSLRLDATHAILDFSSCTFLEELATAVHQHAARLQRQTYLIAENARNDSRTIRPQEERGIGMDAQWNDDFHHALRTFLTGDRTGYYQDYGDFHQLEKAFREGFVFTGEYSNHLERRFGTPSADIPPCRFVVFSQNHDQLGNRAFGEPLSEYVSYEGLKLAAATVLFSPYLPLLFMGEEYDEPGPFLYFISFYDADLVQAVQRGRKAEFAAFLNAGEEPPDPQAEETFLRTKLDHSIKHLGHHGVLRAFYREVIRLRKTVPALRHLIRAHMEVGALHDERILYVRRWHEESQTFTVFNFADEPQSVTIPLPRGCWHLLLDSAAERWREPSLEHEADADIPLVSQAPVSIPTQLDVDDGYSHLTLAPKSASLYVMVD
jgi:maltooligosyltrehalose trehalohydrolase